MDVNTDVLISSGISGIAIVISAAISLIIAKSNNKHYNQMRQAEQSKEIKKHNADAIDNYLKAASKLIFAPRHEFEEEFASTISEMLEHAPIELHDKIKSFNDNVANTKTLYSHHSSPDYLKKEYYDLVAAVNDRRNNIKNKRRLKK